MNPGIFVPLPGRSETSLLRVPRYQEKAIWTWGAAGVWCGLLILGLGMVLVIGSIMTNGLLIDPRNMSTLLRQSMALFLMAPFLSILWARADFDLSLGGVMGLCAVTTALAESKGMPLAAAAMLGIAAGLCIGLLNGALSGLLRLPGFVVTVVTGGLCSGIILSQTARTGTIILSRPVNEGATLVVFWVFLVLISGAAIALSLLSKARSSGGSQASPVLGALDRAWPFLATAFCAALAGLIFMLRLRSAGPTMGRGMELEVLLAVLAGGTWLGSRRANPLGALLGAFTYTCVTNILNLMAVDIGAQYIVRYLWIILLFLGNWGFHAIVGLIYRGTAKSAPAQPPMPGRSKMG